MVVLGVFVIMKTGTAGLIVKDLVLVQEIQSQNVVKYYYDERRSPRYQDTSRNGGFNKNPLRFEVVDNRIRDDRRASSGISTPKSQSRSPERKRNLDSSSSHVLPSQADGCAYNQKMKSASSHDRKGSLETLIDFNAGPKPPNGRAKSQPQQTHPPNNDSNWASFESSMTVKVPQAPKLGTLEALLLELSSPTSVPTITAAESPCNDADASSNVSTKDMPAGESVSPEAPPSTVCTNNAPAENMLSLFEPVGASTCTSIGTSAPFQPSDSGALQDVLSDTSARGTDAEQLPTTQQDQSSLSFAADNGSASQHKFTPVVASSGLSRTSSLAPSTQGSLGVSAADAPLQQSLLRTQSLPAVANCSKREELPLVLFASSYASTPSHASAWHPAPLYGMGYNMQYYQNTPTPALTGSRQPTNPFDISDDN